MALGTRLPLLLAVAVIAALAGHARAATLDLATATIPQLQAAMQTGQLTAEHLVRFYLARIAAIDTGPGGLHAVLAINPQALAEARALDAERRAHGARGPLHGIPILVKDNIDTADPIPTTAGSLALIRNLRPDAPLIARLRAAGVVILGKTNLSEWANFRSSHAISGWSAVGGLTRNPYDRTRTACGSSSGSAAAVAAGLAPIAIGTETDGSVTCPAAMQGLVGLKPSVGRISRTGVVPISHSQDTPGPIAHTVADAELLLRAMAGPDPADPATQAAPPLAADRTSLAGVRLGVMRYPDDPLPLVDPIYDAALHRLAAAGAVLIEIPMPDTSALSADETLVLKTELKADLAAYLHAAPPAVTVRSLADLIEFNRRTPAETVYFGQDLFEQAEATKGLGDPAYQAARARNLKQAGADGIDRLLQQHQLRALIAPTTGPAWTIDTLYGDPNVPAVSTLPAIAGYPHLTVPMGKVRGMPVGLSFIAGRWQEPLVLALGGAFLALDAR